MVLQLYVPAHLEMLLHRVFIIFHLSPIDAVEDNLMGDNFGFPFRQARLTHLVQTHTYVGKMMEILTKLAMERYKDEGDH